MKNYSAYDELDYIPIRIKTVDNLRVTNSGDGRARKADDRMVINRKNFVKHDYEILPPQRYF